MAFARRGFDVLRMVVDAADDDEVVDSAGDVELALVEEAEITGAKVGTVAGVAAPRLERRRGPLRVAPVALAYGSASDPDLADAVGTGGCEGACIDDGDRERVYGRSASHKATGVRGAVGQWHDAILRERIVAESAHRGAGAVLWSGDHERGLSQAVARIESRRIESAWSERFGEASERGGLHGLGADERQRPGGEIEGCALFRADLADAEVVGEVGAAGDRRAGFADGVEPEERTLEERRGGHDDVGDAGVDGRENAADEAHVVVCRQPEHARGIAPDFESAVDRARVVDKVGVAQHDALGPAGRARRVLDHRERIRAGVVFGPSGCVSVGELVGGEPGDCVGQAVHRLELGDRGVGAERQQRAGVGGQRMETVERSAARRVRRDGDTAGVERAEKSRNEFEAGRVRKHDALARKTHVLKRSGDRAGAAVEFPVRHRRLLRRVVGHAHERGVARAVRGMPAQTAHEIPVVRLRADPCAPITFPRDVGARPGGNGRGAIRRVRPAHQEALEALGHPAVCDLRNVEGGAPGDAKPSITHLPAPSFGQPASNAANAAARKMDRDSLFIVHSAKVEPQRHPHASNLAQRA